MKFGFIGAGEVAQVYANHFARHGHEVVLSNSRGPDSLTEIVRGIGPNAKAGTVQEAAKQEIVILAVRWEQTKKALAEVSDWNGRILVDTTNRPLDEDSKGKTGSEIIRELCSRRTRDQGTQYSRDGMDSGLFKREA